MAASHTPVDLIAAGAARGRAGCALEGSIDERLSETLLTLIADDFTVARLVVVNGTPFYLELLGDRVAPPLIVRDSSVAGNTHLDALGAVTLETVRDVGTA
jgi:hypothetical protein